jgi:hypothetical protein
VLPAVSADRKHSVDTRVQCAAVPSNINIIVMTGRGVLNYHMSIIRRNWIHRDNSESIPSQALSWSKSSPKGTNSGTSARKSMAACVGDKKSRIFLSVKSDTGIDGIDDSLFR